VTIVDVAAQRKTLAKAWGDLRSGFTRRELWLHLGWQDIKQRYRRSVLGPIWITIATGTTAVAMGGLYSKLFHLELSEHLPYVTLGLIIWNENTLRSQGAGRWAKIVELNPLLHYLDIVRAPLLGADQQLRHWLVVLVLTVTGWVLAMFALRQYRARVAYWV
jgi:ABC-type polysaccharide/polyol phosphate export permease